MNPRLEAVAAAIARDWPSGRCHYCEITDAEVDGDKVSWLGARRTVCSKPGCVARFRADTAREEMRVRPQRRRRTPADIHELKREEARSRRRAARERRKRKEAA